MATRSSGWAGNARAVLAKDLRSELRTRYALNTILLFGLVTVVAESFAIGQVRLEPDVLAALLWIAIFFAAMSGLAQVFVKEEEARTANTLKLAAAPEAVFLGKLGFNFLLLLGLEIIILPLFFLLFNPALGNLPLFLVVTFLGTCGLVAATTIIAAIIAKASVKGALFAALSFPIVLPLIIVSITATRIALEGGSFAEGWDYIRMLIAYLGVMLVGSYLLFEFVWYE